MLRRSGAVVKFSGKWADAGADADADADADGVASFSGADAYCFENGGCGLGYCDRGVRGRCAGGRAFLARGEPSRASSSEDRGACGGGERGGCGGRERAFTFSSRGGAFGGGGVPRGDGLADVHLARVLRAPGPEAGHRAGGVSASAYSLRCGGRDRGVRAGARRRGVARRRSMRAGLRGALRTAARLRDPHLPARAGAPAGGGSAMKRRPRLHSFAAKELIPARSHSAITGSLSTPSSAARTSPTR